MTSANARSSRRKRSATGSATVSPTVQSGRMTAALDKVDQPEFAKKKGQMLAGMGLNRAGLVDSARSVIGRAQGDESVDPTGDLAYLEAMARTQLGEKDKAISLLSRYYAKNPQRKAFISRDEAWYFTSLENEPRYKALVGSQ